MTNPATRHIAPSKKIVPNSFSDLTVIIPVANTGRRIKSNGITPLIPLGSGVSILEKQIRSIWKYYPSANVILIVGDELNRVVKDIKDTYPVRIVRNDRYLTTNIVYSVGLGLVNNLSPDVMIIYSDLVFTDNIVKHIPNQTSRILINRNDQIKAEEVGVTVCDNKAMYFGYGVSIKWAKIVFLTGKELALAERLSLLPENENLMGHELLNIILEQDGQFEVYDNNEYRIIEVECSKDLERAMSI